MRLSFSVFFVLLMTFQSIGQFVDDFSDGDISSNPVWTGQTERFVVESGELRLDAPQMTGESYLSTLSAGLNNGVWEFYVRMDFGTSGSNYSRVYLMSSSEDLTGQLNGYFVLIGETEDEISLYRQDGLDEEVLIDGVDKSIETDPVEVRVRVTRDAAGNWELLQDLTGGSSFTSVGTALDETYRVTDYFGVRCTYTSTRHDLFFFDDFNVTGTPILDTEPPEILAVDVVNETSVQVRFSEDLNPSSVTSSGFLIDQGISVLGALVNDNVIELTTSTLTNGRLYTLSVSNIEDEAGNKMPDNSQIQFRLLIFSEPEENELLLSEILFNPKSGGVDFVELYNNSEDKYFNLKDWKFARVSNGELEQIETISNTDLSIDPGQYLAFSEDSEALAFDYPSGESENLREVEDLPSYNDEEGTVVLLNPSMDTIQFFSYHEDMHFDLLEDEEGVSLERISFSSDENDPNSWRSASSVVGFATPGKKNSQFLESVNTVGKLTIEPKVFVPGDHGSGRDFTTVNYNLNSTGFFANVKIYDQQGRPVRELANGASLGTSGFFRWDGISDNGGLVRMGYHIVVFELFDSSGKTEILREIVVVGRNF